MSNKRVSTQLFEGVGAIKQVIKQFGTITNQLATNSSLDPSTAILENIDPLVAFEINWELAF